MSAHNYRIVKKMINHCYKSTLCKILAQCCHMATSGRKGLNEMWPKPKRGMNLNDTAETHHDQQHQSQSITHVTD